MSDTERGIHWADGGFTSLSNVYYPDPKKVNEIHEEWPGTAPVELRQ